MSRVGIGYDIHRFGAGRDLWLGGVLFPDEPGLEGHSDADVVLHAIADALLGAAALGDIGDHFPPSDPAWKDVASRDLLRRVLGRLPSRFAVENVDVTVVGERPKIAPHRSDMCRAIAEVLDLAIDQVSVKATTNERLGALGREEGIAALAVVMLKEIV